MVQEDDTLSTGFNHSFGVLFSIFYHVAFKHAHKIRDKLCLFFELFIFFDKKLYCLLTKNPTVPFQLIRGVVLICVLKNYKIKGLLYRQFDS